jgi:hypothetical protein
MTQTDTAPLPFEAQPPFTGRYVDFDSLVIAAKQARQDKAIELAETRKQRAGDLLKCLAEGVNCEDETNIYAGEDGQRIFCELEDEGLILEFFSGAKPEDDYFLVYDYRHLFSPQPIKSLADLGCVLADLNQLAERVLHTFRLTALASCSTEDIQKT